MWLGSTLIVSALVTLIESRGVKIPSIHVIWNPESGGNRTEFFQCKGLPCKVEAATKNLLEDIVQIEETSGKAAAQKSPLDKGACFWYTKEQAEAVLTNAKEEKKPRHKRKLENFVRLPNRKWRNPIFYQFDGSHNQTEIEIVRGAIRHWERMTCIRFFEVSTGNGLGTYYLLFSKERPGCFSYVGRTDAIAQYINLAEMCFTQFGIPVHEIGHALGFWHEQQRSDRDEHIQVHVENIGYALSQFWRRNTLNEGVPYDLGSVMHYSSTAGSWNQKRTIEARDPHYNHNMGQRTGLSYLDAKLINLEYCSKWCYRPLPKPCQRGGYRDPNKCTQCRCPDGFSGTYCEDVAPPKKAECGGKIFATLKPRYITSPGYNEQGYYDDYTECSWLVKAPANHLVVLTFQGFFGIYSFKDETCFHWLEVKSKSNFEETGARYCGHNTPDNEIKSETREMVLIFKSNFTTIWRSDRIGFKVKVVAVPDPNAVTSAATTAAATVTSPKPTTVTSPKPTTVTSPKPATVTSPTTTTTATRTTTTTTTTPTTTTTTPTTTTATTVNEGTSWSEWSVCRNSACACGGCSVQIRQRMCGDQKCMGSLEETESRPCDRLCTKNDIRYVYVGRLYETPCPVCCIQYGFHQSGDKCTED